MNKLIFKKKQYLYRQIRVSNRYYGYFMLIIESSEYLLQTDDAVSCVTVVTGITGPSFTAKDRKLIYQNYLDIQRRNQRLSPQENVQLLLCPIPNTTRMQVSTTRSNGMTLLMIT